MFLPAVSGTSYIRSRWRTAQRMPKAIASLSGAANFAAKAWNRGQSLSFSPALPRQLPLFQLFFLPHELPHMGIRRGNAWRHGQRRVQPALSAQPVSHLRDKAACSFRQLDDALWSGQWLTAASARTGAARCAKVKIMPSGQTPWLPFGDNFPRLFQNTAQQNPRPPPKTQKVTEHLFFPASWGEGGYFRLVVC